MATSIQPYQTALLRKKRPLLLTLTVLFLFFLPLRSIEIPSIEVGLSINFARLFAMLMVAVLFFNVCLNPSYFHGFFKAGRFSNPYVPLLLAFFIFSIIYYYILQSFGQTILFGSRDFFFRSWKGRSLGQLFSFITYAVIPFYAVKKYAQNYSMRSLIEQTLIGVTILLLYYGIIQQVSYYLGLPITGRNIFEGRIFAHRVESLDTVVLRFNSLGGEPRDFGTFIIGAALFYYYFYYGKMTRFRKINIALMIGAFFLSLSTSAYLVAVISLVVVLLDMFFYRRIRIRWRYVKYTVILLLIVLILFYAEITPIITERTNVYYQLISSNIGKPTDIFHLRAQSSDLAMLYYIPYTARTNPWYLLFGAGHGNFLTPVAGILRSYFNFDIVQDAFFADTRSYLFKILVEGGFIGTLIYFMIFFYTLRLNTKLLHFFKKENRRHEYNKTLWLRYAFIGFFVSNAIQISFYYFIIMGLMIGWLNEEYGRYANRNNQLDRGRDGRRVSGVPA